jgi:hypothetical protein
VLTTLERCHRTRSGHGQWKAGTNPPTYCQERRYHFSHLTPTRTACHVTPNICPTRRR